MIKMPVRVKEFLDFIKNVSKDSRIPARDKWILSTLLALIISPFDLIPDWIPFFGQLDDILMLALVADYMFVVLDPEILNDHYPWSDESLEKLKRWSLKLGKIAPQSLKNFIWTRALKG